MLLEDTIFLLRKIGLTDAEAKVYLTLLKKGSASGYEASKYSAVPRSKIYNILESLVIKGFILYSEGDTSNRYAAVPIEEISSRVLDETEATLGTLNKNLYNYRVETDLEEFWHIKEHDNVFAKCRNILKNTKSELLLQIWAEDLPKVLMEIHSLEARGVPMGIVYFGEEGDIPLRHYCRHGMLDEKRQEMGGRFLTLVSDGREVVFGQIINDSVSEVIWTRSRPMVAMAAECVRHDIYFYKNAEMFGAQMQKELGEDFHKIREIFRKREGM